MLSLARPRQRRGLVSGFAARVTRVPWCLRAPSVDTYSVMFAQSDKGQCLHVYPVRSLISIRIIQIDKLDSH